MNDAEEVRVLRPSRGKWLLVLIASGLFVAGGWWMILDGSWRGWLGVGFFGLCVIASAVVLLPGSAYLRITPGGFNVCSLFRSSTYRWNDIERFQVARSGWNRMVAFNFVADFDRHSTSRKIAAWLAGYEGALPDTYGMSCGELAALLNRYKERASAL
ncbi:MAG: STM3941 family protein [Planctomycetota bacterium]|jgi:hypothetical protein